MNALTQPEIEPWTLPGDVTIFEVKALEASLKALPPSREPLIFDLSQVTAIDSAGIQWLAAVAHRLSSAGGRLELTGIPPDVIEGINLLGLGQQLLPLETDHG